MLSHLCTPGINLNWSWYIILFRYFLIQFASCGSLTCLLFFFLIFHVDVLYQVKEVPLYSWLSESFFFFLIMDGCWILSNTLLHQFSWSYHFSCVACRYFGFSV